MTASLSSNYHIHQLTVGYLETVVLHDISIEIPRGATVCIVGVSGSGKTTLLHTLGGILKPLQGNIDERLQSARKAFVLQQHGLLPWKTVRENITLGRINLSQKVDLPLFDRITTDLNIEPLLNRYPHALSGGQSQRVAIARALYQEAELLLMDEPTASLDDITRLQFIEQLRNLQQHYQSTMVYVTHQIDDALQLGDIVIVLSQGSIIACYEQDDQFKSNDFQRFQRLQEIQALMQQGG